MTDNDGKKPTCNARLFLFNRVIVSSDIQGFLDFLHGPVGVLNPVPKQKTESF